MTDKTQDFVNGLRQIADWYEAHPEMALPAGGLTVSSFDVEENADLVRTIAQALGTFEKNGEESLFRLERRFGPVKLTFLFWRTNVCQRRVVKTETTTETVPDPDAPKIEVTREREIVEWDCPPLLVPDKQEVA